MRTMLAVSLVLMFSVGPTMHSAGRGKYEDMRPEATQRLQQLRGQIPEAVSGLKPVSRLPDSTPVDLIIGLPLRNAESLTKLLQGIYDPTSDDYQQYLTPARYTEMFCPTAASYIKLLNFARANKLSVVMKAPNRKFVHVRGSAAVVNKVFHTTLQQYKHPTEDRLFYAPDTDPSIQLEIPVLHVIGLDDFHLPRRSPHHQDQEKVPNDPRFAGGSGSGGLYTGGDFRAAYAPTSLTGKLQSVGVLELSDGYTLSDIKAYETANSIPDVPLQNIYLDGYTGGNPNVESAADIELVMSMAPGLSKVMVYGAPYGNAGIHDILNEMANPTMGESIPYQISTSYYFFYDQNVYDALAQLAAQGEALFVASGDYGSYNETTGAGAFPPADHPLVTSVGGTELQTSGPGGTWTSETAANFSGGGYSPWGGDPQFAIPLWQAGMDFTVSHGSTTVRNAPDVAMVADRISVYFNGNWSYFWGTSASTPLWAGYMALVNQQAASFGRKPIGFANPRLYAIGNGPGYSTAFHDITTGNNFNATNPDRYSAGVGYDLVTGWGSPNGGNLINALVMPTLCQQHPEFCYAIYDPYWWLKCPACGINIFINLGDDFREVAVLDSLGHEVGKFQRIEKPLVENGVPYNYRATLKPRKGMGFVLKAEMAPGKELKSSFKPAYIVRSIKRTSQAR